MHSVRHTPIAAIIFTTGLAMVLASLGDLSDLAGTTTTLLLFVFITVNVAVLVLRRDPVQHHHFVAPSVIPVISVVVIVLPARAPRVRQPRVLRVRGRAGTAGRRAVGDHPAHDRKAAEIDPEKLP